MAGPRIQIQKLSNVPETSAGPNQRAGLNAAPETAASASTPIEMMRPIGRPARMPNAPRLSTATP